ncbi:MAG: hypothetical protein NVS4B12_02870 [Ktedonobacteraceae bacterium]
MTQSVLHKQQSPSSFIGVDGVERRLRQSGAWCVLYFLMQAELGLAWDREWHDLIGRDQFWIPPHIMLYTGVGGAGLIALLVILVDTVRYYKGKAGVDDTSTVRIFSFFHGPLGFAILGFGALNDLLAAPLDNYWHELYGIDVTLWSPFHIMGTIGGVVMGLGSIYAFASEASIEQQKGNKPSFFLNGPEWGLLLLLTAFIGITQLSLTAFAPISIGTWQFPIYALPLVAVGGFCLVGAVQSTRKPGSATLTALLLWLLALVTQSFIPSALDYTVARLHLAFRFVGRTPSFNVALALLPLLFLVCALCIDGIALWHYRQSGETKSLSREYILLIGGIVAVFTTVIPVMLIQVLLLFPVIKLHPDSVRILTVRWPEMLLALPLVFLVGVFTSTIGAVLGDIWHFNRK